jgi:hypothetical protein
MKRRVLIVLSLLLALSISLTPLFAQSPSGQVIVLQGGQIPTLLGDNSEFNPADWIPSDFAGFFQIDVSNQNTALSRLNILLFVASFLQPTRIQFTQALGYNQLIPLDSFDLEDAAFERDVSPWLRGDIVIAYRELDESLNAIAGETLLILPTNDSFRAAMALRRVIDGQDLLRIASYRGVTIYVGDQTALAFTPMAVLVGSEEILQSTIDVIDEGTEAEHLTADTIYQEIRTSLNATGTFAYVRGEAAARALPSLISGDVPAAEPLLAALGESIGARQDGRIEASLLSGAVNGIGVSMNVRYSNGVPVGVEAATVLHLSTEISSPDESATFDPAVLDLIPRSAMVVQSGADAGSTAYDVLSGLPLFNFAGRALSAFPIPESAGSTSGVFQTPTSEDIQTALDSFFAALEQIGGVDVPTDLLDHLDGSYAVAVLPRPNDPAPVINTPFDLLVVAQVDDGVETLEGATSLLSVFLGEEAFEEETIDEQTFYIMRTPETGETILQIGAVDNTLVIGTGRAVESALSALNGDNRLINQERWQSLSSENSPDLYIDVNAFYNTFFPQIVQATTGAIPLNQLGVETQMLENGLYQITLTVTLPQ